jgi:regulator of protease activity HflC (stomatin/prohibitin superfamily)
MKPEEVTVVPVCLCSVCCFLSIFAVIALPLSFKSLEQGKYALQLNWNTQQIADETYVDPGMYMVGLGNMLVEFPSTFQTMYFTGDNRGTKSGEADDEHPVIRRPPLRARSSDGLEMTVALSFQWQLARESLKPLYDILGGGTVEESLYRDEFVRFARAAIVESCANFGASFFFTNRKKITDDMLAKVREAFDQPGIGLNMIKIRGLQLREVDLPDAFDEEIVKTQEQMQEIEVARAERQEQRIIMERELMVREERVKKNIQVSLGAAEKTRLSNEAIVRQKLFHQEKQAEANAMVLSKFWNDTDPWARLFEMMEIRALNSHNDTRLLINL